MNAVRLAVATIALALFPAAAPAVAPVRAVDAATTSITFEIYDGDATSGSIGSAPTR